MPAEPGRSRGVVLTLREFFRHVSVRRRKQLLALVTLMLVGAVAELATIGAVIPFVSLMANPEAVFQFPILKELFMSLGWGSASELLAPMTALFLFIVLCSTMIRLLLLWANARFVYALGYDLGVKLYRQTLYQPYEFHISKNSSETIAATNKVQGAVNGAVKPLLEGITALVLGLAIISALIYIQPLATVLAGICLVLVYIVIAFITRLRLKANGQWIAAALTGRVRCIQEALGGIRDVILDQTQAQMAQIFAEEDGRLRRAQASNNFLSQAPRYLIEALGIFLIVGMAWVLSAREGGLINALPMLGALALGAQRLLPLLQKVYDSWAKITGNLQMFEDILEFLDLPQPVAKSEGSDQVEFRSTIKLEQVGFTYASGQNPVLQDVGIEIGKGSCVGIVGSTGSGKSTLVDIIMGLLEPGEGRFLVDDVSIDSTNRKAWQRHISHVPQHIFLSDASVAENIAMAQSLTEVDLERVREAARVACIADVFENRPEGFRTQVGERGIQLSGGQRQRLGIARAIYRRADLLVLDEATSALDDQTEQTVMENLARSVEGITVIMIAHRTQTLARCDQVIRLESGSVVESGSYSSVLEE